MSGNPFAILEQCRELILLTEVAALIHDLDKLSSDFASKATGQSTAYSHGDHNQRVGMVSNPPSSPMLTTEVVQRATALGDRLAFPCQLVAKIRDHTDCNSLLDLFAWHHLRDDAQVPNMPTLARILHAGVCGCDGLDSEVDKSSARVNQRLCHLSTATVFGWEGPQHAITTSDLDSARSSFQSGFRQALNDLLNGGDVRVFRRCVRDLAQCHFARGLGETRRPANDVLLYDHSYSVASLTKSLLVRVLVEAELTPTGQQYCLPLREKDEVKWRVFSVARDRRRLLRSTRRIGDVQGLEDLITRLQDALAAYIEENLPVGNELYRDEEGIHFVIPDFGFQPKCNDQLAELLRAQVLEVANKEEVAGGDVPVHVAVSEPSSLLTILGKHRASTAEAALVPHRGGPGSPIPAWVSLWQQEDGSRDRDLCPICQVRAKNTRDDECSRCHERRQRRAQAWLAGELRFPNSTIWLGEVRDCENQIALITARFDLSRWLTGAQVSRLLTVSQLEKPESVPPEVFALRDIHGELACTRGLPPKWLIKALDAKECVNRETGCIDDRLFKDRFEEQDLTPTNPKFPLNGDDADKLFFALVKKHPSPARLRRVWRTTQEFWENLRCQVVAGWFRGGDDPNGLRFRRLSLRPAASARAQISRALRDTPSCEADCLLNDHPVRVSLFWTGQEFVTTHNLAQIGRLVDLDDLELLTIAFSGEPLTVLPDTDRPQPQAEPLTVTCEEVEVWREAYLPWVPLLADSPVTFQVLVPAVDTATFLEKVWAKYEVEMSKVRDRLPLDIMVVAFKHKTPLYAALDATRRLQDTALEARLNDNSTWWVIANNPVSGSACQRMSLKSPLETVHTWDVNVGANDPNQADDFYPYLETELADGSNPTKWFFAFDADGNRRRMVHVTELAQGDRVSVDAGRFDFLYLDSTARRFDASAPRRHHLFGERAGQPPSYYTEHWPLFQEVWRLLKRLVGNTTKLKQLEALLVSRYENGWETGEVMAGFAEDTLNILIGKTLWHGLTQADRDLLLHAASNGWLLDVIDFYTRLLNHKVDEEGAD